MLNNVDVDVDVERNDQPHDHSQEQEEEGRVYEIYDKGIDALLTECIKDGSEQPFANSQPSTLTGTSKIRKTAGISIRNATGNIFAAKLLYINFAANL